MNTYDELIDWLRDAYAMERALEISLQKQTENEEASAALRDQARQHLTETRRHADAVRGCLESLGSDPSTLKTGMAKTTEMIKGLGTKFASDERIKDLLAAYASEHFEIACYRALRAGAEAAGEEKIVSVCDMIIPDEERMADWLLQHLPIAVRDYLTESAPAHA